MKLPVAPPVSSFIDVPMDSVEHMNDSHDMEMFGRYCRLGKVDVGNGPTASACCAALSVVVFDGCGTQRIMSGPRSTRTIRGDGSTSTHAKGLGTIRGYMLKVCHSTPLVSTVSTQS